MDGFAPRLSFFWDVHNDFFEEIAKLRAARRIWARHMRDRYGARDPRSWKMRFHCQTAGVTLTAQQPHNNVVRVAYQALAAVLGGTQSLHTNALDETLALPTEESVRIALRTQQILAYETGVPNVADPLGGSYYVEALTDALEREAEGLFAEIDAQGGVVAAIETGWFQRQIAASSMRFQGEVERGSKDHRGTQRLRGGGGGAGRDPEGGRSRPSGPSASGLAAPPGDARRGAGRRSGSRRCGAPPPKTETSYQPCWIVRGPTARCSRSGMCSRKSMAAIASRSSSDGRVKDGTPAIAERLARLTEVRPGSIGW